MLNSKKDPSLEMEDGCSSTIGKKEVRNVEKRKMRWSWFIPNNVKRNVLPRGSKHEPRVDCGVREVVVILLLRHWSRETKRLSEPKKSAKIGSHEAHRTHVNLLNGPSGGRGSVKVYPKSFFSCPSSTRLEKINCIIIIIKIYCPPTIIAYK